MAYDSEVKMLDLNLQRMTKWKKLIPKLLRLQMKRCLTETPQIPPFIVLEMEQNYGIETF